MDERTAEGVEHLQAAARELLGAARAFLDVVEEVVEDSDRLSGAAGAVSDLVRNGFGIGGRHEPWHDVAERGDSEDDRPESARTASWWDEPYDDETDASADSQPGTAEEPFEEEVPADEAGGAAPPQEPAAEPTPAKRSSRVRRIAVD